MCCWFLLLLALIPFFAFAPPEQDPVHERLVSAFRETLNSRYDYDQHARCTGGEAEAVIAEHNANLVRATADLLADPDAQALNFIELEAIFKEGGGTDLSLLDEQNGFILADLNLRRCQIGSHDADLLFPEIVVFSRNGAYWDLGWGVILQLPVWLEDRWAVAVTRVDLLGGPPLDLFAHAAQQDGQWVLLTFETLPYGPGLIWEATDRGNRLTYVDGYRKIVFQAGGISYSYRRSPPCDLDESVSATFYNAFYEGTITYEWTGDTYQMTDETPFAVRVLLWTETGWATLHPWWAYCQPTEESTLQPLN
jgi:hypothetical protein